MDTPISDLAPTLQRLREAWQANKPDYTQRHADLQRLRDVLKRKLDAMATTIAADFGHRPRAESVVADGMTVLNDIDHLIRHLRRWMKPTRVGVGWRFLPARAQVRPVPVGVVGVIAPWNYPMVLSIGDSIPALIAGNAVVLKPDSQTPYCSLANAELLYQAGLPRDVFAVVPGPGSVVGTAIVNNCDYLMFTGSTATGRKLAEQCGRRLIGFSAELGGKNAMIVTAGADLEKVAKAATRACFSNAGQLCISIERIYVERSVAAEFTAAFAAAVEAMTVGPAYDFSREMGSLISDDQVKTMTDHVDDAKLKGATVVAGGNPRPDLGPRFFEPTVLTGVSEEMVCCRDETFGPLVSIYPVADVDEAVARANDTEYGLNASVWAGSQAEGEQIAARLRTGTVNVDEGYAPAFGSTAAPMGGMGASGVGRRHGAEGLLKYTEPQTVATQRVLSLDAPFGIPESWWQNALTPLIDVTRFLPGR